MKLHSSKLILLALTGLLIIGCKKETDSKSKVAESTLAFDQPPQWTQEAIWYQLFVERFRNGDPNNQPTLKTVRGSWIEPYPDDWSPTEWGINWYAQEKWASAAELEFYSSIQMRRYGGDMQGVMDKIDYLVDLGITAVYFNPINDAPSLHKFDARNYRHVDVTFGPDPAGDQAIIAAEDPTDPSTWQMTSADKLFFKVVDQMHKKGIKVIVDFSWNHTGSTFWAFRDVVEKQAESKYKDWYEIKSFDDPTTKENEFEYEGWLGVSTLPDIKKERTTEKRPGHPYEGNMFEEPKQHIFNVSKKYMDPNGDGDPSDGIDGMRLDVAEHVPLGFWRDYRKHVRSINPDFYLVGENWWTNWPDTLMDPGPWVEGDIFDAVMHYQWYKPARHYFQRDLSSSDPMLFKKSMDSVFLRYPDYTQRAMMNMSASHDSPRLATSLSNKGKYKYNASARGNADYNEGLVEDVDFKLVKLMYLHQFTWIGSPQVWMGDEMGMTGGDDPDNRKPLRWDDITFENETNSTFSNRQYDAPQKINKEIHAHIKRLAQLRKDHLALVYGRYEIQPSQNGLLHYKRIHEGKSVNILLNTVQQSLNTELKLGSKFEKMEFGGVELTKDGDQTTIALDGYSGIVWW